MAAARVPGFSRRHVLMAATAMAAGPAFIARGESLAQDATPAASAESGWNYTDVLGNTVT